MSNENQGLRSCVSHRPLQLTARNILYQGKAANASGPRESVCGLAAIVVLEISSSGHHGGRAVSVQHKGQCVKGPSSAGCSPPSHLLP